MKYSVLNNIVTLIHFLFNNQERLDVMSSSAIGLLPRSTRCLLIMAILSIVVLTVDAQVVSPIIHDDSSVTFSIFAPDADEVCLRGDFIPNGIPIKTPLGTVRKSGKREMKKDDDGVWSYTTESLKSDFYTYYYEGDEVKALDTANPLTVHDGEEEFNYFVIPGDLAKFYLGNDVPHGKLSTVSYRSSLPGTPQRRMTVYTPPQYESDLKRDYPVLYLLHGSSSDEHSWSDVGRASQILDNLIAEGLCEPMVVVMPDVLLDGNLKSMVGHIEKAFIPDVVSYAERQYRISPSKQARAIAGISLGGLHSIFITANNPDMFDYVGLFSPQTSTSMMDDKNRNGSKVLAQKIDAVTDALPFLKKAGIGKKAADFADAINDGELEIYENFDEKLESQFENPPRLYYIAMGREDFLKKTNDKYMARLTDAGYNYIYYETEGGHDWRQWRQYLLDFLPRLFK